MKKVIMNIEERLQLKGKIELTADSAQKLFWLCAFATMNHENRDWCSVFSDEDLEVLEYYDDINQYYRHSYGNEISYKTNCPLVADIIDSLKAFVTKNLSYPYGIFRFTHIGTMTALQSILGMYNDSVHLKANNFADNSNRMFRTSKNVPMAANMAFVLYKCDKEPNYMIQILMNERPAVLPCCNNSSLCSFKTFMSCYEAIGKNCDFDAMCRFPTPKVSSSIQNTCVSWVMLLVLLHVFKVVDVVDGLCR
jgi:multiple inositol-polyphosphate phosphatase/2,3-bisphosphoglycerate 3-phosphatase